MIFYSPQTGGFYTADLHVHIPGDTVTITAEEHAALLEAQTRGLVIQPGGDGRPVAVPGLTLASAKASKRAEIAVGHDAALAGVVAISDPTPTVVAVEAALLATTDSTGLAYARQKLATRRAELEAMVEAAQTVEAVMAIAVSYPV
ncbi:tail assembly protein [Nitratidesulfovibrio vulgaris]|uniref:Tail fiber assembly protein, putative n=1 Tax=Nitratidesulfovibrio vulgaris (strain DP4) TaxID=391774 RepID=A0A0H3AD28_NITV4|nr:tail assembly protein [Nitratidesulfovibrio vulgaris]ABM29758.1 tail fiber assembly protein, putative [Nitratidesulfovibrio vulgaris DP4]